MQPQNEMVRQLKQRTERLFYRTYSLVARFRDPYKFVHILSHMRSGSTLLTHLLVSNPEICGYGESHTYYSGPKDFDVLTGKVLYSLRRFPNPGQETYLLDKVLHNYLIPPIIVPNLYAHNCFVIFLLRTPSEAIPSIMTKLRYKKFTEAEAVDYYVNRLASLGKYAQELAHPERSAVITFDQLINQTQPTFQLLEHLLTLKQPLSENYQILPTTGKQGIGDTSKNILSGGIIRDKNRSNPIHVSDETLEQTNQAFNRCYTKLMHSCLTIDKD